MKRDIFSIIPIGMQKDVSVNQFPNNMAFNIKNMRIVSKAYGPGPFYMGEEIYAAMVATSGYITSMYGAGNTPDATKIDSKK